MNLLSIHITVTHVSTGQYIPDFLVGYFKWESPQLYSLIVFDSSYD